MSQWYEQLRSQMPVTQQWAYFDHAAVAPLCLPAQTALQEWAADLAENGDANWGAWRKGVERVRRSAAKLLNADQAEIALIHNTTEGVNIVAEGFPWRAGDNVVLPASEFPTNLYPWMNLADRGVEVRQVATPNERLDLTAVAAACDERTRIVAVSWVGYATGWRNDLDALVELAHAQGALLFVDAIQALGVQPLDVSQTPVDFLAADGHKWLLGPEGAGVFYMRREHLARLRPLGVGWNSVKQAGEFSDSRFELRETAGRYEGGSYNMPGIAALGASLALLSEHGPQAIAERIDDVGNQLCDELINRGATIVSCREQRHRSGIVAFDWPTSEPPAEIQRRCRAQGAIVNNRGGHLRVSPHAYTNADDISRLCAALEATS